MKKEDNFIPKLINEDGTSMNDFPKNPLEEKWNRLYPPIPMPQYSQVCDGYSCMWCGRCPRGEYWECPEEDLEVWNKYQNEIKEYHKLHNPELVNKVKEKLLEKLLTTDKLY